MLRASSRVLGLTSGPFAPTLVFRSAFAEDEELARLQDEMQQQAALHQKASSPTTAATTAATLSPQDELYKHYYPDGKFYGEPANQPPPADPNGDKYLGTDVSSYSLSAMERRRAYRAAQNVTHSSASASPLGDLTKVNECLTVIEDLWIGKRAANSEDQEPGMLISNLTEHLEAVPEASPTAENDLELLTSFVQATPAASIQECLKMLDRCKSAADVESVYQKHIFSLPLWSDVLNGHGTRVVVMGKMTEVVARTFCVDQWLEVAAHARRYGFTISRLHVNEVLTAIRIDASAMFQNNGRDPLLALKTIERLQLLMHFSKQDAIMWEGVFMARLFLICTVVVSFMDRQNYYRSQFPSDFHRRDGIVGDWVISHARAIDYDETVRIVNRFLCDEGLEHHRHNLRIRPAFTTLYRLLDYYFATDNLSQTIATIEDAVRQGVNIAESTIAKMMQLAVAFNHPRTIDLFRKYRLRMPEAVIATPDVSRLMTFYCRSGGGLPCPCCGEPYNHRNIQLSVWDATPSHQRRCPLLRMARDQRGELEELPRNSQLGNVAGSASSTLSSFATADELAESTLLDEQLFADAPEEGTEDKLLAQTTIQKHHNPQLKQTAASAEESAKGSTSKLASMGAARTLSSTFVDLPQCRDWSHIAFSLYDFSKEGNLLWTITEWRIFLQCCTYLREPEEILAQVERDVRRAKAMRRRQANIDPESKWSVIDPPSSKTNAINSEQTPSFMGGADASSKVYRPCDTDSEISDYLKSFENVTVKVSLAFAKRYGLTNTSSSTAAGQASSSSGSSSVSAGDVELNDMLSAAGEFGSPSSSHESVDDDPTTKICVPWLKLSKAAKFDLAHTIFRTNINFVTQVDDFVQRMYLRFLRGNDPKEVNVIASLWFDMGVGTGRGSSGGEIAPIISEELMIASFAINSENVNKMKFATSSTSPLTLQYRAANPNASIPVSTSVVAKLRSESAHFASSRVHTQDLFVTAFAKRRARREMFNNGFLIKVKKAEIPANLMSEFNQKQRASSASAYANQHSSHSTTNTANRSASFSSVLDRSEKISDVVLPPIDISKYSDDQDEGEKDFLYVINPKAVGRMPTGGDFRFTVPSRLMAKAALSAFEHLTSSGSADQGEEIAANEETIRAFIFLMRKKPRNIHARATFKDSGSDISPGYNKKNWYMIAR